MTGFFIKLQLDVSQKCYSIRIYAVYVCWLWFVHLCDLSNILVERESTYK